MKEPIVQAESCPLTGVEKPQLKVFEPGITQDFGTEGFQWYYPYKDNFLLIVASDLYHEQRIWDDNREAIFYIIENDKWPKGKMVDMALLEVLISSTGVPATPMEKINELLSYISSKTAYFGESFGIYNKDYQSLIRSLGFNYHEEIPSLIRESERLGLLEINGDHDMGQVVVLTIKGWELAESRNQEKQSKIAFIAMSFDPEMVKIYNNWIEPAIRKSGFEPYIVLDRQQESDVTINDAILAGIKKAKFTIADFTHHRSGVYFEAGYALGRGQKVIYTCREDEIGTAHFDTRNYQHLVWKDGADLKKKLMDKIEVFIKA